MNGLTAQLVTLSKNTQGVKHLRRVGMASAAHLMNRLGTALEVEVLAKETGMSEHDVKGMAARSDLQQIAGLKSREIELLIAAGIASVATLAKNDPAKLLAWLREVNSEARILRSLPKADQVLQWIQSAKEIVQAA